jgi:hypothetical protein
MGISGAWNLCVVVTNNLGSSMPTMEEEDAIINLGFL